MTAAFLCFTQLEMENCFVMNCWQFKPSFLFSKYCERNFKTLFFYVLYTTNFLNHELIKQEYNEQNKQLTDNQNFGLFILNTLYHMHFYEHETGCWQWLRCCCILSSVWIVTFHVLQSCRGASCCNNLLKHFFQDKNIFGFSNKLSLLRVLFWHLLLNRCTEELPNKIKNTISWLSCLIWWDFCAISWYYRVRGVHMLHWTLLHAGGFNLPAPLRVKQSYK